MNERGDALLETVMIAPVILLIGLVATEFGVSALRRSQLSESIRSTVNRELVNAQDSEDVQEGQQIEFILKEKLKGEEKEFSLAIPNIENLLSFYIWGNK